MKKYNIGLDIGTSSVGWAVVEKETNKVIRKFNKKLWGVRLFEEANTAEETRKCRNNRRRLDRRRKRINLLKREFQKEVEKIDPFFFQKLQETFYNFKKDNINKKIPITEQEKELTKEYYKKFPTIYHLRNELINNEEQQDIRLVYLAIHHIIKYRGNFLFEGKFNINNLDIGQKLKESLKSIVDFCDSIDLTEDDILAISLEDFENILKIVSRNDQKIYLKKYFENLLPKNMASELSNALMGNNIDVSKFLSIESEEDLKINFKDSSYDDKYSNLEKELGIKIKIMKSLKELYDIIFLKKFFEDEENASISNLMVKKYQNHKKDLQLLKDILVMDRKKYCKVLKNEKEKICLYEQYIKNAITYDEFAKELKKILEELMKENANLKSKIDEIITKLDEEKFLPRITSKENGKYPYQLNENELIKIIENQGKYYPFLLEKTSDKEYRLQKLLKFRIPYYVGPLNNTTDKKGKQNKNAWLVRKNNDSITPYNFNEVVDLDASAQIFIERMISHCTYLLNEPALPNNSLLYSKFKVLNELKQIKINDHPITKELREKIYNELFLKTPKTITDKMLKQYLSKLDDYVMYQGDFTITGYSSDGKFANNMISYVDFFGENGIFQNTTYQLKDAENFIKWITIFESKDVLERKICKEYPNIKEEVLKKILSKKYSGWGSLSEKLLTTKYYKDKSSGIIKSIMDLLETENKNFNQILYDKEYNFQKMIEQFNQKENIKKINYELVENLVTSPSTKRGIYQALKVLEEIIHFMGYEPEKIVIEMARGREKKERKDERKKKIEKIYTQNKNSIADIKKLTEELKSVEKLDEKLYLYFLQAGKSLYSREPLDILKLEECEIDHIIPQSLKKDDSIDNKALVIRRENQDKSKSFLLPVNFRNSDMIKWWKKLKDIGLMTERKFRNLCRGEFKEEELEGFIHRQLVETRQITKHVANIIKNYYKNTDVIYLHANLSHNYREKFELYKYRQLNDFHHAHDAYLASVLGEYIKTHFKEKINFENLKKQNQKYYDNKEYDKMKYGYVINSLDNNFVTCSEETGEILFDAEEFNKIVERTMYQQDIIVTRKTEIKTGEFYKGTKQKAKANVAKPIPLKNNLPTWIYGSYRSLNASYAMLVKYRKKGKKNQKLIGMPIYYDKKSKFNPELKDRYIKDILKLDNNDSFEIIKDKIPFYTELDWNGKKCFLVGATENVEVWNANEFKIDSKHLKEWRYTLNKLLNSKQNANLSEAEYIEQIEQILKYILNKIGKEYPLYKEESVKLENVCIDNLSLEQKEQIITELLNMTKCNSKNANLKILNLSDRFGRKNKKNIEHVIIINKSITGIKEWKDEL